MSQFREYSADSSKFRNRVVYRLRDLCSIQVAVPNGDVLGDTSKWQRTRILRLIIEYLLQEGLSNTGSILASQYHMQVRLFSAPT